MTPKQLRALADKRIPGACSHKWQEYSLDTDICKLCGTFQTVLLRVGKPVVIKSGRSRKPTMGQITQASEAMIRSLHGQTMLD